MKYNKLVRDKIPEIIRNKSGIFAKTHTANDIEYWEKLRAKLVEEAREFEQSGDIEELVDVEEVLDAIITFKKFRRQHIEKIRHDKLRTKGGFQKRIILEEA